jgi:hypothetical protein
MLMAASYRMQMGTVVARITVMSTLARSAQRLAPDRLFS